MFSHLHSFWSSLGSIYNLLWVVDTVSLGQNSLRPGSLSCRCTDFLAGQMLWAVDSCFFSSMCRVRLLSDNGDLDQFHQRLSLQEEGSREGGAHRDDRRKYENVCHPRPPPNPQSEHLARRGSETPRLLQTEEPGQSEGLCGAEVRRRRAEGAFPASVCAYHYS